MNTYEIFLLDKFGDIIDGYTKTFKAETPGKAKYQAYMYWLDFYQITFKDFILRIKCKHIGKSKPSDYFTCPKQFERVKKNRNIDFCYQGMRIVQGGKEGFVCGGNYSGNIDVLFDGWNCVSNCHPHWNIKYYDKGNLVKKY